MPLRRLWHQFEILYPHLFQRYLLTVHSDHQEFQYETLILLATKRDKLKIHEMISRPKGRQWPIAFHCWGKSDKI